MREPRTPSRRPLLPVLVAAFLASACSKSAPAGAVGAAYVEGNLDGQFAGVISEVFQPTAWRGQVDGPVFLAGSTVAGLDAGKRASLRAVMAAGQPVLLTKARQSHVVALHAIVGTPPAVDLDASPNGTAQVYALAYPSGRSRVFHVDGWPLDTSDEPLENRRARTEEVVAWIESVVRGPPLAQGDLRGSPAASTVPNPLSISTSVPTYGYVVSTTMPVYWGTCGVAGQICTNNVIYGLDAWPVWAKTPPTGQGSDYFILQSYANVSTLGCEGFYGSRHESQRIAGYWLRQANMIATPPPGFTPSQISILDSSPPTANPSATITTGFSWNISGSGSVGINNAGEPSGSLGFGWGCNWSNSTSTTIPALSTTSNIGATGTSTASWTYDSWQYVHAKIEPTDHACPSGLQVNAALPKIIYGGTFSPSQTWLWNAAPAVRTQFSGCSGCDANAPVLPVSLELSVLLGWTFYNGGQLCGDGGSYALANSENASIVGSGPLAGLSFDVSCNETTNYGTIPLGPSGKNGSTQDPSIGNPGTPYPMSVVVNVPFALIPQTPTITSVTPASGPAGTPVNIYGTNLEWATVVQIGGSIYYQGTNQGQWSYVPAANPSDSYINFVIPYGQQTGGNLISVGGGAGQGPYSDEYTFTVTGG